MGEAIYLEMAPSIVLTMVHGVPSPVNKLKYQQCDRVAENVFLLISFGEDFLNSIPVL